MTLKLYSFSGSPRAMGEQHGEELRTIIHDLAEERIDIILTTYARVTLAVLESVGMECVSEMLNQVPEVHEEVLGIADAAGIPLWKLQVAGGYSDIEHRAAVLAGVKDIERPCECTLIPVRLNNGDVLLAGTWDSHATAVTALVIVKRHPHQGPETLALTTAGWPMQQGVNSNGVGFAIANLVPRTSCPGITYIAALPKIAAHINAERASLTTTKLRLCSGRYFALCDETGDFFGIESDGFHYLVVTELHPHTNHYIFHKAKDWEARHELMPISEERRKSAEARVGMLEHIDATSLLTVLSYNDGTSSSIYQNGEGRDTRTGACFVIEPAQRMLHYAVGQPEEGVSHCLSLRTTSHPPNGYRTEELGQ